MLQSKVDWMASSHNQQLKGCNASYLPYPALNEQMCAFILLLTPSLHATFSTNLIILTRTSSTIYYYLPDDFAVPNV